MFMRVLEDVRPSDHVIVVNLAHGTRDKFCADVAEADALVADYDASLHPGNHWNSMRALMTPDLRAADEADLAAYLDGGADRTDHDDIGFIFRSVERLEESVLTTDKLARAAAGYEPREGTVPFLMSFERQGECLSNVCVMSFGIRDFIHLWLERVMPYLRHGMSVMALRLKWTGSCLVGYEPHTVVSDGNKGFLADAFCASRGLAPGRTIILGDAPTDLEMLRPENIGILLVPKVDDEPARRAFRMRGLERLWPRVSAVLVSDSLTPLAELRS